MQPLRWLKRGHLYSPGGQRWWARKYASFPTAEDLGDRLRVYFTALDEEDVGRTGYVDLDARDPSKVLFESPEPVLDIGEPGTFDDRGANAFSVVTDGGRRLLYYQGWQRTERVPYLIFSSVAVGDANGGALIKVGRTPILDRTDDDPFLRGAPFVLRDGERLRMWYVSCRRWVQDQHGLHYQVAIRHAVSADGLRWSADPEPCLTLSEPDEYAVGRPSVLIEGGLYRMWYSIRSFSQPYRIGYAESPDGVRWTRLDHLVGIERSESGWDSEMICYPNVIRSRGRLLLFHNGNRHGATGFGFAEAIAPD